MNAPQHKVIYRKTNPKFMILSLRWRTRSSLKLIASMRSKYFVAIYKRSVTLFRVLLFFLTAFTGLYLYSRAGVQITRLEVDFFGVASIANREKQPHFFLVFYHPGIIGTYLTAICRFSSLWFRNSSIGPSVPRWRKVGPQCADLSWCPNPLPLIYFPQFYKYT